MDDDKLNDTVILHSQGGENYGLQDSSTINNVRQILKTLKVDEPWNLNLRMNVVYIFREIWKDCINLLNRDYARQRDIGNILQEIGQIKEEIATREKSMLDTARLVRERVKEAENTKRVTDSASFVLTKLGWEQEHLQMTLNRLLEEREEEETVTARLAAELEELQRDIDKIKVDDAMVIMRMLDAKQEYHELKCEKDQLENEVETLRTEN